MQSGDWLHSFVCVVATVATALGDRVTWSHPELPRSTCALGLTLNILLGLFTSMPFDPPVALMLFLFVGHGHCETTPRDQIALSRVTFLVNFHQSITNLLLSECLCTMYTFCV